jgi:hypothetical protein
MRSLMNRLLVLTLLLLLAAPGLTARADDGPQNKRITIKSEVLGEDRVALAEPRPATTPTASATRSST